MPFSSFAGRVFSSGKLTSPLTSQSFSKPCWPEPSLGPRGAGTYCCFHFSAGRRQLAEPVLAVAMCEAHWPPEANPTAMLLLQMHDLWLPGSPPTMPKTMAQMRRSQAIGSLQGTSNYEGLHQKEASSAGSFASTPHKANEATATAAAGAKAAAHGAKTAARAAMPAPAVAPATAAPLAVAAVPTAAVRSCSSNSQRI